ncbi:hypothetical protein [Changpingibacter yushuensis]|uniref:hypothetical protein n=1 Tax=Changpingibacter yushuensis TaxID=2758440 RepID=UPI00165E0E4B|nr:hypothetical protein [Changpingibacter yushuensis]
MSTRRATGVISPDGSDDFQNLASDLLKMALTSNRIPAAATAAAAQSIVDALATTSQPTSATDPLVVYRTDLSALMAFDGSTWSNIGVAASAWTSPTAAPWGSSTMQVMKVPGVGVFARGRLKKSPGTIAASSANTGVVTVPADFAPAQQVVLPCGTYVAGATPAYGRAGSIVVNTNGTVDAYNPNSTALTEMYVDGCFWHIN